MNIENHQLYKYVHHYLHQHSMIKLSLLVQLKQDFNFSFHISFILHIIMNHQEYIEENTTINKMKYIYIFFVSMNCLDHF